MKRNMNGYYVCVPLFVCLVLAIELVLAAGFKPTDKILLSCRGPAVSTDPDGREWTTDNGSKFGSSTGKSNPAQAATQDPVVPQIPFNSTALQTTSHHHRSTKQPTIINPPPSTTSVPDMKHLPSLSQQQLLWPTSVHRSQLPLVQQPRTYNTNTTSLFRSSPVNTSTIFYTPQRNNLIRKPQRPRKSMA